MNANFTKSTLKGIPVYDHSVQIPVVGTSEDVKIILKQLDKSDLCAAIQCVNGDIEIYGFENGLETQGYTYDIQAGIGGASITLRSKYSEYQPPYLYAGNPDDFDDNFLDIPDFYGGDFNNDFNNDFFIEGAPASV